MHTFCKDSKLKQFGIPEVSLHSMMAFTFSIVLCRFTPSMLRQLLSQASKTNPYKYSCILIQQISKQIHFKSSHDVLHREMRYV